MNYCFYTHIENTDFLAQEDFDRLMSELPGERIDRIRQISSQSGKNNALLATVSLRRLLCECLRMDFLPPISASEHGKPYFPDYPDIHFNYSHTKNELLCAISSHEIGVDIQAYRRISDALLRHKYSNEENWFISSSADPARAAVLLWTYKESYLKAIGSGLNTDIPLAEIHPQLITASYFGRLNIEPDHFYYGSAGKSSALSIYGIAERLTELEFKSIELTIP